MIDQDTAQTETPLLAHAIELRHRLIISLVALLCGFLLCYSFAEEIYSFLVRPLAEASGDEPRRLIYTGLAEAFISYIRLSLWGGLMISFPVIATQIWKFIAPGLYQDERKAFLPFLIASPLLFFAGAAMAYVFVFPVAWDFFLSFETTGMGSLPIQLEAKVSEYLSLSMTFILAFGLAFQMPVALILLAKLGIVSAAKLASFRRFAIVLIFACAAIMTPPDIFSQVALAIPMLILYEISVFGARFVEKRDGRS